MKPDVRIFENIESLSEAAAELFVETSAQAIVERGRFLAALSGGNTPTELFKLLGPITASRTDGLDTRSCVLGRRTLRTD